ncbi:hypothetical protein ACB092_03G212900 [Castanea dentata]
MLCLYQLFLDQTLPLPAPTTANKQQISHHTQRTSSSSESISFLRPPTSDIQPTNSPKAKQRLGDAVRERIRSTEITHKASISKKVADDAAVEVSVPERTTIPSGDDSVWADVSPLLESACKDSNSELRSILTP